MPNVEWDVPQTIQCRFGDLDLNVTDSVTLLRYQVLPGGYQIVPSIRVTQQNLSQQDGSQMYPRFKSGLVASMSIRLQKQNDASGGGYEPACGSDLRAMSDRLALWLNSMRSQHYGQDQRYIWTPTGLGDRMLRNVELLAWTTPSFGSDTAPEYIVSFSLESPFPYAVDASDTTTSVSDGDSAEFANNGSADLYPVIKVYGPTDAFTIENTLTALKIEYDADLPGAASIADGDYAEIDCFKGSVFLNGSGDDLIPGVVPSTTDFFTLIATPEGWPFGVNNLTITGADMDVIWAQAYS